MNGFLMFGCVWSGWSHRYPTLCYVPTFVVDSCTTYS